MGDELMNCITHLFLFSLTSWLAREIALPAFNGGINADGIFSSHM